MPARVDGSAPRWEGGHFIWPLKGYSQEICFLPFQRKGRQRSLENSKQSRISERPWRGSGPQSLAGLCLGGWGWSWHRVLHVAFQVFSFNFSVLNLPNEILFPVAGSERMTLSKISLVSSLSMCMFEVREARENLEQGRRGWAAAPPRFCCWGQHQDI